MSDGPPLSIPYCGTAPVPGDIWGRWNLDPVLIAVLLACLAAYASAVVLAPRRVSKPVPSRGERLFFYAGWLVLALSLVSPLCSLSVALSAARIGQHMLITLLAAPLLILGRPQLLIPERLRCALLGILPAPARLPTAVAVYAGLLWAWHTPMLYDATFASSSIYWIMHATMIGSALALWASLLAADPERCLLRLFGGFATSMQMTLLGALLTFSQHAWFDVHAATTWPWGLDPLEDQQLGGLLMWIPGGAVFLFAGLAALLSLMRRLEHQAAPQPRPIDA